MTNESTKDIAIEDEGFDEDFESPSECHRSAAYHFLQAAKQHSLAAQAWESGDQNATDMHSFMAYRHQLNAVQYAEIAVMEVQGLDEQEDLE
jgi:hypothetical protein